MRYDDMFTDHGQALLGEYLGVTISNFPAKAPRTSGSTPLPQDVQRYFSAHPDLVRSMRDNQSHVRYAQPRVPFPAGIGTVEVPSESALVTKVNKLQKDLAASQKTERELLEVIHKMSELTKLALKK